MRRRRNPWSLSLFLCCFYSFSCCMRSNDDHMITNVIICAHQVDIAWSVLEFMQLPVTPMISYIISMLTYVLHLYKMLLKCSYCLSSGIIVVALVAHSFLSSGFWSPTSHVHYFKILVVFRCSSNWEPIVTNSYVTRTRFQLMRTNEYKASHMRTNAYNWVSNDKQILAFLIRSLACNFR